MANHVGLSRTVRRLSEARARVSDPGDRLARTLGAAERRRPDVESRE